MPLPTGPIPLVAFDAIIEESWGDQVAQSLNNLVERKGWLTYTPGDLGTPSSIPANTSGSMVTWLTPGNLYVPSWATDAIVTCEIAAVTTPTPGGSTFDVQFGLGSQISARVTRLTGGATNARFAVIWTCRLDVSVLDGDQPSTIYARKDTGTAAWTADAITAVAISIEYFGAIG